MEWVIIHPFGYSRRSEKLEGILEARGKEFINLASDYSHVQKKKIQIDGSQTSKIQLIETISYKKNISIKRLISHIHFSFKALIYIRKVSPKYIYCRIPPNILLFLISNFFKRGTLVVDIYDLWPESFPTENSKITALFFKVWKYLRDSSIKKCKVVILECNYYKKFLPPINDEKLITVYPEAISNTDYKPVITCLNNINDSIQFCYLGTINNIVDFDSIDSLFQLISQDLDFIVHFIGRGESKKRLQESVMKYGGKFMDYGPIFSDSEKNTIINNCHYGLNLFDKRTVIGLSLKSIEYMKFGLPIISNLQGDTKLFIKNFKIGINFSDIKSVGDLLQPYSDNNNLKDKVRSFYLQEFSRSMAQNRWEDAIRRAENGR